MRNVYQAGTDDYYNVSACLIMALNIKIRCATHHVALKIL